MHLRDLAGDEKPQPQAAETCRPLRTLKRLENTLTILSRNARALDRARSGACLGRPTRSLIQTTPPSGENESRSSPDWSRPPPFARDPPRRWRFSGASRLSLTPASCAITARRPVTVSFSRVPTSVSEGSAMKRPFWIRETSSSPSISSLSRCVWRITILRIGLLSLPGSVRVARPF